MNHIRNPSIALIFAALTAAPAFAQQTSGTQDNRNVEQQQRIKNGLQSGQLNTREAGHLENQEKHVDNLESRAATDGHESAAESARIQRAQNRESRSIYAQKHDAQTGHPDSASSRRLQGDVQRDVNQQQRIDNGVKSGQLTTREAGTLEHGQARDSRVQANAAANGHVGAREQNQIARNENRQSQRTFDKKHNARARY